MKLSSYRWQYPRCRTGDRFVNELLDAHQIGWTITASPLAGAALLIALSTAFVAMLVKQAGEGREDGSLREDWTLIDVNRSAENR